ncbi:MAG: hypothetical protein ACYDAJ_11390 [Nitrosotalea sp.]
MTNSTTTHHIGYQAPKLSSSENQSVVNVALSIPELQNWSHDWKYVDTSFLGNNKAGTAGFEWQYAMVYLKAPPNSGLIPCDIGWEAEVTVDITTMKVVSAGYPTINSQCHGVGITGGGPGTSGIIAPVTESPLKQFLSGIAAKDIQCENDLQLILKAEDGSPACVTPDTAQTLMEKGWTREVATSNLDVDLPCNGITILSPNYHAMMFPVLLMQLNSTSCVKLTYTVIRPYGVDEDGVSWPRNETIPLQVSDLNYEGDANKFGITQGKDYTNSFNITAFPKIIDHTNYPVGSNFTVTYLIRPLPNATGFYDQSMPMPLCLRYPLAVGHTAEQVNSSDFSKDLFIMLNHSCMRGQDELVGVEVKGMSYTEMKLP